MVREVGTLRPRATRCSPPGVRSGAGGASLSSRPRTESRTFGPNLAYSPCSLPKTGRGGCGEAGIQVGFSLRSCLSSPRGRRRGPRPEAPSVCGLRRPFAQTLLIAGRQPPGPGALRVLTARAGDRSRNGQRNATSHLLVGHSFCGEA